MSCAFHTRHASLLCFASLGSTTPVVSLIRLCPASCLLPGCSVSGCSVLRQVLLASPALTHVKAAGCARLLVSHCSCLSTACAHPRSVFFPHSLALPLRGLPLLHQPMSLSCRPSWAVCHPCLLRAQDVRLGTASLAVLDFENCSNLREVQLSESGGGSSLSAAPLRTDGGSGGGSAGAKPQPKVCMHVVPRAACVIVCGFCCVSATQHKPHTVILKCDSPWPLPRPDVACRRWC